MKFIHAADLHIDSPLRGLDFDDSSRSERVRRATRDAFSNLLTLAIDERVDFVIIAGDLFDGKWPDMRTGLWTAEQFRRLREHDIKVYLIRGNHDAESIVAKDLSRFWPKEVVCEFDSSAPQTIVDPRTGAVLHGQSYAERRAPGDLAAGYPQAEKRAFNIGVLHTSLTGDPNHIPYAPTTPANLAARGYDYWALGHIHQRGIVQQQPHVVFAGNTQGRHIKEEGAKGCYVVTVENGDIHCEFRATDVIRWQPVSIALPAAADETDLFDSLQTRFHDALDEAAGRPVIARLTVSGACRLHEKLAGVASREQILAEIRNQANDCGELWIEQISCSTRPAVDIDELRQAGDIVGELLRSFGGLQRDEASLRKLAAYLEPLFDKVGDALGDDGAEALAADHSQNLRRWLEQAEGVLLGELLGGEA